MMTRSPGAMSRAGDHMVEIALVRQRLRCVRGRCEDLANRARYINAAVLTARSPMGSLHVAHALQPARPACGAHLIPRCDVAPFSCLASVHTVVMLPCSSLRAPGAY